MPTLTAEDIKLIIDAQQEVFYTKEEMDVKFDAMHASFSALQSSVDVYAKKADLYYQEMAVMLHRLERMEDWIKQAASKIGVEYKV